jgi:hypothetical protein
MSNVEAQKKAATLVGTGLIAEFADVLLGLPGVAGFTIPNAWPKNT